MSKATQKRVIRWLVMAVLILVVLFSGIQVWSILRSYRQEAALHEDILAYRPEPESTPDDPQASPASPDDTETEPKALDLYAKTNQSILDLQAVNSDVLGWISIPDTEVDYPFVQAEDNDYYLYRDIYGQDAKAGTVFMDCRCDPVFGYFNTILYGHNMKNGSMFGTVKKFAESAFFDSHPTGTLYLAQSTYALEIFAYMVVKPDDAVIYYTIAASEEEQQAYFEYVQSNARRYRDIELTTGDRIVTLSTCSYEFDNARVVLLARLAD